jgi:hypothetical protein
MKTINFRKNPEFSPDSKVVLHVGTKVIHIKGFGSFSVLAEPDEEVYASHLWTGSNKIDYNKIEDGNSFVIKPRLSKLLALIIGVVFLFCSTIFILTSYRWSFLPLIPFIIYIVIYLTILKDRYLIIEKDQ